VPASTSSDTGLTPDSRRIRAAIDRLLEAGCGASDRVRSQGMSQAEAAQVLAVSVVTVYWRLSCGLQRLAAALADVYSGDQEPDAP
jgi:RNA polymerase sigma-70 factor (ECF subfamily)